MSGAITTVDELHSLGSKGNNVPSVPDLSQVSQTKRQPQINSEKPNPERYVPNAEPGLLGKSTVNQRPLTPDGYQTQTKSEIYQPQRGSVDYQTPPRPVQYRTQPRPTEYRTQSRPTRYRTQSRQSDYQAQLTPIEYQPRSAEYQYNRYQATGLNAGFQPESLYFNSLNRAYQQTGRQGNVYQGTRYSTNGIRHQGHQGQEYTGYQNPSTIMDYAPFLDYFANGLGLEGLLNGEMMSDILNPEHLNAEAQQSSTEGEQNKTRGSQTTESNQSRKPQQSQSREGYSNQTTRDQPTRSEGGYSKQTRRDQSTRSEGGYSKQTRRDQPTRSEGGYSKQTRSQPQNGVQRNNKKSGQSSTKELYKPRIVEVLYNTETQLNTKMTGQRQKTQKDKTQKIEFKKNKKSRKSRKGDKRKTFRKNKTQTIKKSKSIQKEGNQLKNIQRQRTKPMDPPLDRHPQPKYHINLRGLNIPVYETRPMDRQRQTDRPYREREPLYQQRTSNYVDSRYQRPTSNTVRPYSRHSYQFNRLYEPSFLRGKSNHVNPSKGKAATCLFALFFILLFFFCLLFCCCSLTCFFFFFS